MTSTTAATSTRWRPRALLPWARSETPGYRLGGNRFDLETFRHEGGRRQLGSPKYEHDIALRLAAVGRGR